MVKLTAVERQHDVLHSHGILLVAFRQQCDHFVGLNLQAEWQTQSKSATRASQSFTLGLIMYGDFFLVEKAGVSSKRAVRLPIGDTGGRNEAWLRDTLFTNPELLPINDIDPSFGPLLPLCRELRTDRTARHCLHQPNGTGDAGGVQTLAQSGGTEKGSRPGAGLRTGDLPLVLLRSSTPSLYGNRQARQHSVRTRQSQQSHSR